MIANFVYAQNYNNNSDHFRAIVTSKRRAVRFEEEKRPTNSNQQQQPSIIYCYIPTRKRNTSKVLYFCFVFPFRIYALCLFLSGTLMRVFLLGLHNAHVVMYTIRIVAVLKIFLLRSISLNCVEI